MNNSITDERLLRYFDITKRALAVAQASEVKLHIDRKDFLDMIQRYVSDAEHFKKQGRIVDAFACLNYAHGWLDAGARMGIFDVHDNELFVVD